MYPGMTCETQHWNGFPRPSFLGIFKDSVRQLPDDSRRVISSIRKAILPRLYQRISLCMWQQHLLEA